MRFPRPLPCAIALALAIAAFGRPGRPPPPAGAIPDDRIDDRVVGTLGGPVVRAPHGAGAPLDTGDATVWVWSDRALVPGARVAVTGRLRTPRGLLDPGVHPPARADYELTATAIEELGSDAGPRALAWRWAGALQMACSARIVRSSPNGDADPGSAALQGIVTGDRGEVPPALDRRWRALGIYHVLSVSGLHLAVVAGLVFALLRRLLAASPWGGRLRPARWAAPPALAIAVAYTLVTGAQLATLRALLVIAIVLIAQMLDRPVKLVDALGAAAIALLAWRPADLWDPSFELSFVAAITLAVRPVDPRRGIRGWLVRGLATSAWVALTTAPITAYHFHQVAAGGVIGNLVLTPIVEVIALPLALAGLVLGGIGTPLVRLAAWLVGLVDDLAGVLAHVTPVGTIAIASATLVAVAVALSLWLAARRAHTRRELAAWLVLCAAWALGRTPPPPGALRVTFLDVGQGDAALVELPDGATWLVDAGGLPSSGDLDAASAPGRAIAATLAAYGRTSIDLAIVSHPHPDHYLGLAALDVPIAELWSADAAEQPAARTGPLPGFDQITAALDARGTPLAHPPLGVARSEAGVELVVWAPRYAAIAGELPREAADPVRSVNDNSLVVAIRFAGRTLLFAGDLEAEGEDALVAAGLPAVDVVKVAHHGSPTSSSPGFVAASHPAIAVISCGVANQFHFPSPEVVARWRAAGAAVERTDVSGAIAITIAPSGALAVDRFAP